VSTPENPARWAPDPVGRHQYRYWDGAQWTEHVADNGVNSTDPLTATAPTVDPVGAVPAPVPGTAASATTTARAQAAFWSGTRPDPTAILGRRYGAFLVDAVICTVVFLALFFPFATERTPEETLRLPGCHLAEDDSSRVECDDRAVIQLNDTVYEANGGAFLGLCVLFTFLYFAVVEGLAGGSLGKLMTGARVVTEDGSRIGIPRSIVRWAVFAVDGPLSLFLCGIITSSVSRGHRRLGDMAANTYVVGRDDTGRPVVLP
jgi:uncharacterized RDD family membrane protein YckC